MAVSLYIPMQAVQFRFIMGGNWVKNPTALVWHSALNAYISAYLILMAEKALICPYDQASSVGFITADNK